MLTLDAFYSLLSRAYGCGKGFCIIYWLYSTAVEYYTRSTVIFDQLESILMLLAFLRKRKRVKLHVRLPHIAVFRFQKDTPTSREFHSTTRLSYTYVPSLMGDDLSRRVCTCFLKLHHIPIVIVSMKYLKLQ